MDNKIVMISIAAVIGIIVLGSVLMPIMNDATATTDTFSNVEGSQGYFIPIGPDTESYTLSFDGSSPGKVVVNGEDVPLFDGTIIAMTDSGIFRCNNSLGTRLSLISSTNTASQIDTTLTITITNGVFSYVIGTAAAVTMDISDGGFAIAKTGDYVMTGANQNIYLNKDSLIYGSGLTSVTGGAWNTNFQFSGSIEDGVTVIVNYPVNNNVPTISNEAVVNSPIDGHKDLYDLEKVTFDATLGDNVTSCTYDRIIVPAEITAERSVHFTPGENAIFAAMPIMIILAVLLGVVALVIRSRMD